MYSGSRAVCPETTLLNPISSASTMKYFPQMNRRSFLSHAAMAVAGTQLAFAQSVNGPVVQTSLGTLRGTQEDGVSVFRGVPFAQPPVGPLRFRAPQPALPWKGVREATRFAAAAMQSGASDILQSEDCLYLNIWAPSQPGPHPVFVWIHGGGFTGGRSFDPLFDGARFARQGIVCITIAYRLGVFGFLDFGPEFGQAYEGGANNALRDIIRALTWVQANIAPFGGDAKRVTIGGESAGAKLTDTLMGVPSAAGLFQQMISESGGAERIWSSAQAAAIATQFLNQWKTSSGRDAVALKAAPAVEILKAQGSFIDASTVHFPLRAEVDGKLIPQFPLAAINGGLTHGKRLLLGTNHDESGLFIGPHPGHDPGPADLGNLTVGQFRPVEAQYAQLYPEMSDTLQRIRSLTAEEYWIPSLRVADAHVRTGGTAFVYRFDYAPAAGRFAGLAVHASELAFVWEQPGTEALAAKQELATAMHDAWSTFIRGKTPQAPGLPAWPVYNLQTRPTMLFNTTSRVEDAPQKAEFDLWDGLLTR